MPWGGASHRGLISRTYGGSSSTQRPRRRTRCSNGAWISSRRPSRIRPTSRAACFRSLASVVLNGTVDGKPFRTETTLLPDARIIKWSPGQCVRTLVSQYFAYLDGRIQEVALDFYAQADDGSVWYFGEDVYNYRHGVVADTSGTWLAGKEGPAAMIMPADDPRSHATGAATTRARLAARVCGGRVRALAVGRLHGSCDEPCLAGASRQRRATQARRPMSRALRVLERTARARSPLTARNAALDVRQAALDLKLRFRPPAEIDRARFDLWARRVGGDARRRHHAVVVATWPRSSGCATG